LVEVDFCEETVAKVKSVVEQLLAERPVKELCILAAQIASQTGNLEEYDAMLDKLVELDPFRARAYSRLKSTSDAFC
jgi:hypothetical protein